MSGPGTQYGTDYTINGSAVPPSIIIPKDQDTATFSVSSSPAVASDKVALIMVSGATGGSIVSQPGVNLSEDSLNIITNSIKPEVGFDYTSNPQAYPAGGPETKELFSVKNSRLFNSNVEVFLSGSSESTNTGTYSFVSGNGDIVDLSTGMNFIVSSNQQIGQVNINCVSDTVPEDPIYKAARLPGRMGLWYYPPANRWWLAENPSSQSDEMDSGILMQQANIDMLLRTTNTNSADPDLPHSDSEIQGYFDQGFTFLGVKSPFIDERGTDGKRINDDWPVSGTYVGQDGTTPKSVEYWMLNHEAEFHTVAPWDNYYNLEYNSLSSYSSGDRVWVDDTSYNYAGSDRTRLIVFEASATVTPGQLPQFTPGTISNILSTPLNGNGWTRVWNSHTNSYLSVKKGLDMTVDSVRAGADSFKAEWPDKKLYYFFGKGVCVAGFNGNGANTRPDIVLNDGTVLEDQLSWFSSVAAIDSFDGFLFDYYPFNSKPQGASYYKNADPPASYLHPLLNIWVVDNDAKWVVSGVHRIKEWSQSAEFPNGKPVYPTLAATPNFVSSINTTTLANGGDYTDGGKLAAYHQDTPTYLENYNLAVSCLDAGADGIIWYTHTWKRKTFNSGNGSYQSGYAGPEASFWPICHKVWRSSSSNGQGQFNDPITDPLTGQWVNLHQLYFPNHPNVDLSGDGTLENMVAVSNYVKNYFIGSTGDANNFPDGDSLSAVILSASVDGGVYDNDVLDVCSTLSDAGAYFVQAALPPPPGNFNVNNTSQIVSWQGAETSATTGPRIATVLHPYHSNVQFVNPGEGNSTNKIEVPSGGLIVSGQLFTNVKLSTTNNLRFVDCTFSGQQDFHNGISQWYTVQEITANSGRNELVDFEYCHLTGGKNTVYSTFRSMHKCSLYHVLSDHLRLKTSTVGYTLTNCWLGSYQDAEDSILNNFSGMYDSNSGVHADPEMVQASNGAIKKLIFRSCNFQGRDSFWSDGTYRADSHKGGSLLASVLVKVDFDEIVFDDCVMYGGGHYFLQVNINSLPNTPRTVTISNCRIGTSLTSNIISIQDSQGSITKIMHSNNWLDTGTPVCKLPAEAISQGVTTSNNGVNLDVNDVLKGVDSVSFNGLGMNVLGNTPWGKRSTPI